MGAERRALIAGFIGPPDAFSILPRCRVVSVLYGISLGLDDLRKGGWGLGGILINIRDVGHWPRARMTPRTSQTVQTVD